MTDYDNNMTFALFVNDKGDNPKRPDRTGFATVNGVEYKMAGWLRKSSSDGSTFLSGTLQLKDENVAQNSSEGAGGGNAGQGGGFDDDPVPFANPYQFCYLCV